MPATVKTSLVKKNARGRRKSHAARLETQSELPPRNEDVPDKRRKPRGEDVRDRVLQSAIECFGAFGFAGTSTRAVADRAGLSHPLVLYHFKSKEQLWRNSMEDLLDRYRAELVARRSKVDADDPVAGLRAFIENFVEFSARVPQLHRIMTQQSTQGSDRIHWLIDTQLRESVQEICKLIRKGQKNGSVRKGDPARLYYAVIGLGGTLFSVSAEFQLLTDRDVFADREVRKTIEQILEFLFV